MLGDGLVDHDWVNLFPFGFGVGNWRCLHRNAGTQRRRYAATAIVGSLRSHLAFLRNYGIRASRAYQH